MSEENFERSHSAALERLRPPTEEMLLEPEGARAARAIDRMLKDGSGTEAATQAVLEELNAGPPVMYTRGGGFAGAARDIGTSILDGLLGLYVPVDAVPVWLPPSQRYMHEQTWWTAPAGAAVAHKSNGKLTSIQGPNTTVVTESAWSGVYASLRSERARFGTLSRVTIEPEVNWTSRDSLDVNRVWNSNIDGHIWFDYRIWTVVYQLNVVTGQYEPLLSNRSALATSVAHSIWHIVGGGQMSRSGTLRNGAGALAFVVEPDRTYLFGVVAQTQVSHSLRRTDRRPIPQPSGADLTAWGLLKADVPAIYMSHVVLAQ
jgi:hypothetical protein